MTKYNHGEAFCHMKYRSDDGTEEEIIFNSRDGVTPFVISLKSGKSATHVEWHKDRHDPDYVPKPGERVFIDLTMEKALEYAQRNKEKWEAEGYDDVPPVEVLAEGYMERQGAPDIMEIK